MLFDKDDDFEITVLSANWKGEKLHKENIIYIGNEMEFKPFKSVNREFTLIDNIKHPSTFFRSLDRNTFNDKWYKHTKAWIDNNKNNNYDMVIASYTPINAIRLGTYAKTMYNSKYIVDMRDMMSIQGQKIQLPFINSVDNMIDKYWLRKADSILSVGPTICTKASEFYKKNVHLIYNAFLEKDFLHKEFKRKKEKKFIFSYLGTMGIKRNPRGLIHIVDEFCQENQEYTIEINFASQDDPNEFIKDLNINNVKINWLGYIDKIEVEKLKSITDCFVLLEDMDEKGKENVTGKIFEYMLEQKPVIAYCNKNSDIKTILNTSGIGKIITNNIDFKQFILLIYNNGFIIEDENILQFSREKQYEIIKGIL